MASSAQLLHLPTEILRAILAQVPSRVPLTSLARSCQRLQPLVEPFLYQSVYLGNHDGESFIYAVNRKAEKYYSILVESMLPTNNRLVNLRRLVVKGLENDIPRARDDPDYEPWARLDSLSTIWSWLFEQSARPMRTNHERPHTNPHPTRNRRPLRLLPRDHPPPPKTTKPRPRSSQYPRPGPRNTNPGPATLAPTHITKNINLPLRRCLPSNPPRDPQAPQSSAELHPKRLPMDYSPRLLPHKPKPNPKRPKTPCPLPPHPHPRLLPAHNLPTRGLPPFQTPPAAHDRSEGPTLRQRRETPPSRLPSATKPPALAVPRVQGMGRAGSAHVGTDPRLGGGCQLPDLKSITVESAKFPPEASSHYGQRSLRETFWDVGVELGVEGGSSCLDDGHLTIECQCCSFYWQFLG
ncbi:hypothetical protein BDV23DRAFT_181910 [Aspergillus alliaceus]|uniref:F-box domain-containing protein n=1 Tax=Petromyces alliaceus TaxID=209559 RepID=A0A5N7CCY1_PETAA|nr:hypothetical protein BDV23DRAFT_181910 [Aspergillus alliaceus]